MRQVQAEGLSDKARKLLNEMLNSGNAQQVYIAEALDEIASNGEGQETNEFLANCAHELSCEAALVATTLKPLRKDELVQGGSAASTDPDVVVDILLLADVTVDEAIVRAWSDEQRESAADWAAKVHLRANDNDDVVIPPCPYWVPPGDTDIRLAARVTQGEASYNWKVMAKQLLVGSVRLPSYFDSVMARRFAWQKYKAELKKHEEWTVV